MGLLRVQSQFTVQDSNFILNNQLYIEREIKEKLIKAFIESNEIEITRVFDGENTTFTLGVYISKTNKISEMMKKIKEIERINTDKRISVLLEEVKETLNI